MPQKFKSESFSVLLLVLLVIGLRLPDLWSPYYNIDELTNSLFANMILDGRLSLADFLGNTYISTHYFYVAIVGLFGRFNMMPLYACNILWSVGTVLVFYLAGKELTGKKEGGLWAGIFYAVVSVSFMSKDYRAILAEGLSLLPLAGVAFCYFRFLNQKKYSLIFCAGVLAGLAGLFKAPAAAIIVAIWISLLAVDGISFVKTIFLSALGLTLSLLSPLLLYSSPIEGLALMREHLAGTGNYIGTYSQLSFYYWASKFLIRTILIAICALPIWLLAGSYLHAHFVPSAEKQNRVSWGSLFFLFIWLLVTWLVASLGKRVFYHYFVFMLAKSQYQFEVLC